MVAQGVGCCTNQEVKYRWRDAQRVCPRCQVPAIIKGQEQYGGGWICWKKREGCGAKFGDGDQAIEGQKVGRVENPDPLDQTNTIMKMAEKRAVVDAALKLPGVARFFTQDLEAQTGEPATEDPEKPTQQPARRSQGDREKVTSEKANRLMKRADELGVARPGVMAYISEKHGQNSPLSLTDPEWADVMDWLETQGARALQDEMDASKGPDPGDGA